MTQCRPLAQALCRSPAQAQRAEQRQQHLAETPACHQSHHTHSHTHLQQPDAENPGPRRPHSPSSSYSPADFAPRSRCTRRSRQTSKRASMLHSTSLETSSQQQRVGRISSSSSPRRLLAAFLISLFLAIAPLRGCSATATEAVAPESVVHSTRETTRVAEPSDRLLRQGAAGSSSTAPRYAQYANDVPVRWSHTSVIADQTLYIFGGKNGTRNKVQDYVAQCLTLDLSKKFGTDSPPWSTSCSTSAPLIAGHSAIINNDINMIIAFGGTVPDGKSNGTPLHLFSTEIGFWKTPGAAGFPKPLVNHTAILQVSTGDMVVFGGAAPNSTHANPRLSNSTFRMVTDRSDHVIMTASPRTPFSDMYSPSPKSSRSSDPSTMDLDDSPKISGIVAQLVSSSALLSSTGLHATPATRFPTSSSATPMTDTALSRRSLVGRNAVNSEAHGSGGSSDAGKHQKRAADGPSVDIMTWINSTLPAGVSGRVGHTASVISDGAMVVLGGSNGTALVGMDDIYVYSILTRTWLRRSASGSVPKARRNHVAVVANNSLIVLHGGTDTNFTSALGDIAVLDTTTWTWSVPSVSNSPAGRYAHSAAMAGPYMLMAFGYVLPSPQSVSDHDSGLYILDTTSWQFVTQFDPSRAGLVVHYTSHQIAGGTIFGLFVASVVGLFVLLILAYIAYIHYYNRHPELMDDGDGGVILPTTELRNLGRKLTVKLGGHSRRNRHFHGEPRSKPGSDKRRKREARQSAQSGPAFSLSNMRTFSYGHGAGDDTSLRIMFDLSRESSFEHRHQQQQHNQAADGASEARDSYPSGMRYSRRIHLDDVELPTGLRNRDESSSLAGRVDDNASVPHTDLQGSVMTGASDSQWSRSAASRGSARGSDAATSSTSRSSKRKSKHVSAILPRVIGSRLTLPAESASALARYRFDELENSAGDSLMPPVPAVSSHVRSSVASKQPSIAMLAEESGRDSYMSEALAPPVMPAAQYEASVYRQRTSSGSNNADSDRMSTQAPMRDSIDINAVMSRMNNNNHFYVANPDD
ncbi:hypothetical protein GQ54DRAFT_296263 [Martensiomyces pterosporus]|nr:hypothetical protein GQ54DRAFT_296263 [Martensiomyces pterosporus]